MTKGTPNELEKYTAPPLVQQLVTGTFAPITLTLNLRETYIWQRLGGAATVRRMIAPPEICSHCAESKTWPESYQGWFCFTCHRDLNHLGLLPFSD
jgi:hypothetical protein